MNEKMKTIVAQQRGAKLLQILWHGVDVFLFHLRFVNKSQTKQKRNAVLIFRRTTLIHSVILIKINNNE
jgi:hypothetical protein